MVVRLVPVLITVIVVGCGVEVRHRFRIGSPPGTGCGRGDVDEATLPSLHHRLVEGTLYSACTRPPRARTKIHNFYPYFTLNGKKVDIPSLLVKAGDVVAVKAKSTDSPKFKEVKEMTISTPEWISIDTEKLEGKVLSIPTRAQIDTPVAEHLIVELYSK